MGAETILYGVALREAAKPWLQKLGKSDQARLTRLLELSSQEKITLGVVLQALFPADDTQAALANLTRLRNRLNEAAAGLSLRFQVDTKKKSAPAERYVWFSGPDAMVLRASQYAMDVTSDVLGFPAVKSLGVATTGSAIAEGKRLVRVFVSYAPENAVLAQAFKQALAAQLRSSKKYEVQFRSDCDILVGELSPSSLEHALKICDLGLLLVSLAFLETTAFGECSTYIDGECGTSLMLVGMAAVNVDEERLKKLGGHPGSALDRGWFEDKLSAVEKREFAQQICSDMECCLDGFGCRWGPTGLMLESQRTGAECEEGAVRDAIGELEDWVTRQEEPAFLALLGDVGVGKTTTLKRFTRQLIEKRQKAPEKYPLPIYIDLCHYMAEKPGQVPTLEELLTSTMRRMGGAQNQPLTSADLLHLVRESGALIMFDSVDEKMVHFTQDRAREFIRILLSVLGNTSGLSAGGLDSPPSSAGRVILSCRGHYFRDTWSLNAMLHGGGQGRTSSSYPVVCLRPFNQAQVHEYLASRLGNARAINDVFEFSTSLYQLEDLAQRPQILALLSERLKQVTGQQIRGEAINITSFYESIVQDWLSRDVGRHQFEPTHKRRLMENLAASLWRLGQTSWEADRLEEWLDEFLHSNAAMASAYAAKERPVLKDDLRTATFLLRSKPSESKFCFAHVSLQEFFLACYLARALKDGASACWDMPHVSTGVFDFLGQMLAKTMVPLQLQTLERLLEGECIAAACLAFRYWLRAMEKGYPEPRPNQVNLGGANLEGIVIRGRSAQQPLRLRGANLRGACLNRAKLECVDLSEANLDMLEARQAVFQHVHAAGARLTAANLAGLDWRFGSIAGALTSGTVLELAEWHSVHGTPPTQRSMRSMCEVRVYVGHRGCISSCAWNPPGSAILTASADGSLKIWEATNGRELVTFKGHTSGVTCCSWHPNGEVILSGANDKTLRVWDVLSGKPIVKFDAHQAPVTCCSLSPDGRRAISGGLDGFLRLWDTQTGHEIIAIAVSSEGIACCAWSPVGSRIAYATTKGALCIANAANGQEQLRLAGSESPVLCCAWSPDGRRVLGGAADGAVTIWDSETGIEFMRFPHSSSKIQSCVWGAGSEARSVAWMDDSGGFYLGDVMTGRVTTRTFGQRQGLNCCSWNPHDERLLLGDQSGGWLVWDAAAQKEVLSRVAYQPSMSVVAWSSNDSCVVSNFGHKLKGWSVTSGGPVFEGLEHPGLVSCCDWTPHAHRLASGSGDASLRVWDATTGSELLKLWGHQSEVVFCRWSPDGSKILSGADMENIKVWDIGTGSELRVIPNTEASSRCGDWSPDGNQFACAGRNGSIRIHSAETGELQTLLAGHLGGVQCCVWSPDGTRILSGGSDQVVRIWCSQTQQEVVALAGHQGGVRCCAWSPDGKRVVSASQDKLKIWDVASGREQTLLSGHEDWVCACAWSPDGTAVVSVAADGTLKLWNVESGHCLWTGHALPENQSVVLSGDGLKILHASSEAWRWLGWEERDMRGRFARRLPVEIFGALPRNEA